MSWELLRFLSTKCPCGMDQIKQEIYGDDWFRIRPSRPIIECTECQKKFQIIAKKHPQCKPHHGGEESYYLLPIDYPDYTGTQVTEIFKTVFNRDFVEYLIITYDSSQLIEAYNQMIKCASYVKLTGTSKSIAKEYKSQFNTQREIHCGKNSGSHKGLWGVLWKSRTTKGRGGK